MPPLPSNLAARLTNHSLSSYYGAVAVYSGSASRSRPVSATTFKASSTAGMLFDSYDDDYNNYYNNNNNNDNNL